MRIVLASLLLIAGCDALGDLVGGDDPAPAPTSAPAPVPPQPATPVPTDDKTETAQNGDGTPQQQFDVPGLGIRLPFPVTPPSQGGQEATPPEPPARGSLPPAPAGSFDANGSLTRTFTAQRAVSIHHTLLSGLFEQERQRIATIPFEVATEDDNPNAMAICRQGRTAKMVVTTAMLALSAGIAEVKAYDELAGTSHYDAYVDHVVEALRRRQRVPGVPAGLLTAPSHLDPHKLSRQIHLFDQQVAFVIGHELAHHYRGHTGCVRAGNTQQELDAVELQRVLSAQLPPFSQATEVEADMWAVTNVLECNHRDTTRRWSEEGGIVNMDFFARLMSHGSGGGRDFLAVFLSTHPPSELRGPIVQQTARQWTPGRRPVTLSGMLDDVANQAANGQGTGDGQGTTIRTPIGDLPFPIRLPPPQRQ